jgi:hypothetical protein
MEQTERKALEDEKYTYNLLLEKQQMHAQLCIMESAHVKDCAKIDELSIALGSAQEKIQTLSSTMKVRKPVEIRVFFVPNSLGHASN